MWLNGECLNHRPAKYRSGTRAPTGFFADESAPGISDAVRTRLLDDTAIGKVPHGVCPEIRLLYLPYSRSVGFFEIPCIGRNARPLPHRHLEFPADQGWVLFL